MLNVCHVPNTYGGIKDALSPTEEAADPTHLRLICCFIVCMSLHILLIFLSISALFLFSLITNLILYFYYAFIFSSSVVQIFIRAYLLSSLFSPLCFAAWLSVLHVLSHPLIFLFYFPLFYSQYQCYLSCSLHLMSRRGEDKRD